MSGGTSAGASIGVAIFLMKLLYHIYQVVFLLPFLVVSTFILGLLIICICPLGSDKWRGWFSSKIGQLWGWLLVRATFLPVTVEGKENIEKGKSYVIVANHQSCYDIFLLIGFLPCKMRWMMKASLMNIFVLGRASRISGHVAVDTSSPSMVHETYLRACSAISNGVSLVVFPEGHRTSTGVMGAFKRGAFMIADRLQAPVVPVTIEGTYEVMPKHRDFKFARRCPVKLTIHKPIMPIGSGNENIDYLRKESHKIIKNKIDNEALLQ